jgi:hypothetical protein
MGTGIYIIRRVLKGHIVGRHDLIVCLGASGGGGISTKIHSRAIFALYSP